MSIPFQPSSHPVSQAASRPVPGFRRGPRVADAMTREHAQFVASSYAAERSGEAAAALEYHRGVPMFTRSRHVCILEQLAALSEEMTSWMWARWAAYQCTRAEDVEPLASLTRLALGYTGQTFYGGRFEQVFLDGGDPISVTRSIFGESWVYRQLCAYELGGLEAFLNELATGRLRENSALARRWVGARMNGFQLRSSGPGRLLVHDLRARRDVELLDLGAGASPRTPFLLGRVVASGTAPGLMFETAPVCVDEQTAYEAAADPSASGWLQALASALADKRIDLVDLESEDLELVSDVAQLDLVKEGTPADAYASTMDSLRRGRDEVGRAAFRILRDVVEGRADVERRAPYVAAAVLIPHAYVEARAKLAGSARWADWAERAPEPASGRLWRLAGVDAAP